MISMLNSALLRSVSEIGCCRPSFRYLTLKIGDKASQTRVFTASEVESFAQISGDNNPVHLDEKFAATTRYQKPIVHGVLMLGMLSGILGTRLPGIGSVLLSYKVQHKAPLFVGETVTAEAEITEIEGRKVTMNMSCRSEEKVVLDGSCDLLVPRALVKGF